MAGTYTATGTISNLTRLELEQLRKADFFSNSKALTIGDSALLPEGVVGKGDVNAEPYFTGPNLKLDDVYSSDIPTQPGPGLTTLSSVGGIVSETVRWYGPTYVYDSQVGFAFDGTTWQDNTPALNFTLFVNVGDLLLIKPPNPFVGDQNSNTVATITARTANTLTLSNINNPSLPGTTLDFGGSNTYSYIIVRPRAVQLFAVPGSGPVGREATFLMVDPSSTLHSNLAPSIDQINADRIKSIVPASYALDTTVDRSDSVFASPAPRTSLDQLGYRVILYTDNGTGTAPNLSNPISALNPVIDSTIPASDQRMTFDFKAGIVRFSCAPRLGDDIKVAGGVNPTSGRLSLYATFWAVDQSLNKGASRSVHAVRSTDTQSAVPGNITFDPINQVWLIGATNESNELYVDARNSTEVPGRVTQVGTLDSINSSFDPRKYIGYRRTINAGDPQIGFGWRLREFTPSGLTTPDPDVNLETRVSDKQSWSVGDASAPSQNAGADFNTEAFVSQFGTRFFTNYINVQQAVYAAAQSGYGVVHLRRGAYQFIQSVKVPPGVEIRGEGASTIVKSLPVAGTSFPVFTFGPNNNYGTFDFGSTPGVFASFFQPVTFSWAGSLEGYDVVWNPARRVWGIVQADLTTHEIWFNEVNTKGEALYPGVGIAIKQNVNNLFSSASPNSQHHTGGHYPRIAHHHITDEYSFVWVEEYNPGGGIGPRVAYQGIKHDPLSATGAYIRKFTPNPFYPAAQPYLDHPSISVDNHNFSAASYLVALTFWSYDDPATLATTEAVGLVVNNATGTTSNGFIDVLAANAVVSSTDVDGDDGNFLYAYSYRAHPVYYQTTGASTAGFGLLSDASPPAGAFTGAGVVIGSRYIQLWQAGNTDSGRSGILQIVGGGGINIRFDDFPGQFKNTVAGTVHYVLSPPSNIVTRLYQTTGTYTAPQVVAGGLGLSTTDYQITEREPDYVRVKAGGGRYLVAYQTFDTNGYLSQDTLRNFANNSTFFSRSLLAQRQHIATCYVIVSASGNLVGPSVQPPGFAITDEYLYAADAHQVTMRSLGGRTLNVPNPNLINQGWGLLNDSRLEMEISARNYCLPWSASLSPSFIPDVTWSGSDWVIVCPSVTRIQSDTGTYVLSGTPKLQDPSFFFNDAFSDGGQTINTTLDQVYFPSTGELITIAAVDNEHQVTLSVAPSIVSGTHQVSWRLVKYTGGSQFNVTSGGLKNQGFRVSANGEVTIGGGFFTFADPPVDGNQTDPRVIELLRRDLWSDGTFTGDLGTGQFATNLPRYGSQFINWNDAITTSRVATNLAFRGIVVGGPKGVTQEFPNEPPMVAIAWGENFYGFLDRSIQTGSHSTAFFRQSFGPWNSGLKEMNLQSLPSGNDRGLKVLSKEHVFTRHGYSTTGQPHFATDGFRNVFSFVGMQYLWASEAYGNIGPWGDLREEGAYFCNINSVHTDAVGRDATFHRGPPMAYGTGSPREFVDNLGSSTIIDGTGIERTGAAAPKVIWNGKDFVAFFVTMVPNTIPAGMPQPLTLSSPAGGTEAGPQFFYWPKYRALIHMINYHGDEHLDKINDVMLGSNQLEPLSPITVAGSFNTAKIVANAAISCGGWGDWEQREIAVMDVAYSGNVYCVVWTMGYNPSPLPAGVSRTGGSIVGYTLFPDVEGTNDVYYSQGPTGVSSYIIEVDDFISPGDRTLEKARMLHPKVVWNGKKFLIIFQFLDDSLGGDPSKRYIRSITVGEQGPGARPQIKALSANTRYSNSFSTSGVRRAGSTAFIGSILPAGFAGNLGIFLRGPLAGTSVPWSNFACLPGDIVEITGITPGAEGAVANTEYNGFWPVQDFVVYDSTTAFLDLGANFARVAPAFGDTLQAKVHGIIYSGGFGGNTLEVTDGSFASGVNTKAWYLLQENTAASDVTLANYVTRLHGLAFNPTRGEYAILAECQVSTSATNRLRLLLVKETTMAIVKELDLTTPDGTVYLPAALGWNGSQYLVCYGQPDVGNTFHVYFSVVSQNLTVEQTGTVANHDDLIWTGSNNKTMPGPGYGTVDLTLSTVPVLDSLHIEWNDTLNRWAVSVSVITGGSDDFVPYSARYNEKQLAYREPNNLTSWTGSTITLTGVTSKSQVGQRVVFSREETPSLPLGSPFTPDVYANSGSSTLNGAITASATSLVVSSAAQFHTVTGTNDQFFISVGSPPEIMLVTGTTGTTFNVTRGLFDTPAVAHPNGAFVFGIPDSASIDDVTNLIIFGLQYHNGDQVQVTSNLQKPRLLLAQQSARLRTDGTLHDATGIGFPSPVNTYTIQRRGRATVFSSVPGDATFSSTSLNSSTPHDFIALGVKPGMEVIIYDAGNNLGTFRGRITGITSSGGTNNVLTFSPAISPIPGAGNFYWVRKQANLYANILSRGGIGGSTTFTVDVLDTERSDAGFFNNAPTGGNNAVDKLYYLPREDVFVFTLGYNSPAVRVTDADSVYMENIDIGGMVDIEERHYHMARPLHRTNGPVVGAPGLLAMVSRAPSDRIFLNPRSKVQTLRLTNVRSKTTIRYGDTVRRVKI